jgi:sec-independent protein translocase protein TatA
VPNFAELIVIFMILLLVFGASRLPALGEGLGRTIRGFKRGIGGGEGADTPSSGAPEKPQAPARASVDEPDEAELVDKK